MSPPIKHAALGFLGLVGTTLVSSANGASYDLKLLAAGNVSAPSLNNKGVVVWRDLSTDSIGSSDGRLIAQRGGPVEGSGLVYDSFGSESYPLAFNDNGVVGFKATLRDPSKNVTGVAVVLAPQGVIAVSQPLSKSVSVHAYHQIGEPTLYALNNHNKALFFAQQGSSNGRRGIFSSDGTAIMLEGDPVPGIPGAKFTGVAGAPSINNLGQYAFLAGTTAFAGTGVFTSGQGLLFKDGDALAGAPGRQVTDIGPPVLNDSGDIAVGVRFADGGSGIFTRSSGVIAQTGTFLNGSFVSGLGFPALNDRGNVAFGVTFSDGRSGFFTNNGGLVAFTGEPVPGLDGYRFTGHGAGEVVSINNSDEIAFVLGMEARKDCQFSCFNAFGVFLATPVPEPSSLALLACGAVMAARLAGRRLSPRISSNRCTESAT